MDEFSGTSVEGADYWHVIFDQIPFPIYIVDIQTFDVIFANKAMRLRTEFVEGGLCHQVIYGQPKPCFFCRNKELVDGALCPTGEQVFEHFNDLDDRWYQLHEHAITCSCN